MTPQPLEARPADPAEVSRLGLGMAALGRPAYITLEHGQDFPGGRTVDAMRVQAHEVLDAAFAAGVRYVDAARSYGESEAFVRAWLDARVLPPGSVTVGSKWGYEYVGAWQLQAALHERKDHSLATLRRQLAESSAILGEHLALYQIHSATLESGVLEDAGVMGELAGLRERGVRIGVTASGPAQAAVIRRAMAIRPDGRPLFATVQATWNLLERSAEEALVEAHAAGHTVLVKEVLANGRLTARGDGLQALAPLALARGTTVDAIAIAAALAQPWAGIVLLGASSAPQLRSNLRALEVPLATEELTGLASMRVPADVYWKDRARLPWS